ncbi:MAG: serpin family protein [Erysipelotrichaceae bacterium]|nr:serpin family protein [Erysipelotrichaceae bacterium]
MKRKNLLYALGLSLLICTGGCSAGTAEVPEKPAEAVQTAVEVTEPAGEPVFVNEAPEPVASVFDSSDPYASETKVMSMLDPFMIRLMQKVFSEPGNHIFSPMSLILALSMAENGTAGVTRAEIESTLGISTDDLNQLMKRYLPEMNYEYGIDFYTGNSLWFNTDNGLTLKASYLDHLREYYDAAVFERSFADKTALAQEVNDWTKEKTDGSIPEILQADDLDQTDPMLLLNALAAGGKWMIRFQPELTSPQKFHNADGSESTVSMMRQSMEGWWHDSLSEGVVLYLENGLEFTAILPNEGVTVEEYLNKADPEMITNYYKGFISTENEDQQIWTADVHITNLSLPKYNYNAEYELDAVLKELGIQRMFTVGYADFSEMAEGDPGVVSQIYVKKIRQKADIEVNEEEVRASAATVVMGGLGAGGYNVRNYIYHDVVFDRPFIFLLSKGRIPLFAGVASSLEDTGETVGDNRILRIEVTADAGLNVRSGPDVSNEKYYTAAKGTQFYAYETRENGGYTWYRIGNDQWIADQDNEWVKVLE